MVDCSMFGTVIGIGEAHCLLSTKRNGQTKYLSFNEEKPRQWFRSQNDLMILIGFPWLCAPVAMRRILFWFVFFFILAVSLQWITFYFLLSFFSVILRCHIILWLNLQFLVSYKPIVLQGYTSFCYNFHKMFETHLVASKL